MYFNNVKHAHQLAKRAMAVIFTFLSMALVGAEEAVGLKHPPSLANRRMRKKYSYRQLTTEIT